MPGSENPLSAGRPAPREAAVDPTPFGPLTFINEPARTGLET
jgi:hypothetical protein